MKVRIGNDIHITWTLKNSEGEPYILSGHDFKVYLQTGSKKILVPDPVVNYNVLYFTSYGKDQQYIGEYNLLLVENNGRVEMLTYDVKAAFELVAHSWETDTIAAQSIIIESTAIDSELHFCGERNVINIIRVNDVALVPDEDRAVDIYVPTALSQLDGDEEHRTVTDAEKTAWSSKSDFSGAYDDLTGKPDLSQFITNSVDDLVNYYLKSETYTKEEVAALIGAIDQFHYEIAASTSAVASPQSNVLYLIGPTGSGADRYEEYVYTNTWVKIGDTSIDLSGYVTTSALNTALADYTTTTDLNTLLADKQDKIDSEHKLDYSLIDNTPTVPSNLADLSDVSNTSPTDGQALIWDNANSTWKPGAAGTPDAVKYVSQSLTSEQQAQARTNIGAGTSSFSGAYNDLSGKPEIPSASDSNPAMDGTAAAGSASTFSRSDHVHPSDTSKVDKVNGKGLSTEDYTTAEKNKLAGLSNYDDTALAGRVSAIEGKIPTAATSSNQLADKNFVNSSISTATATFRGTYNLVSDLSLTTSATAAQIATALSTAVSTADNNDYVFVQVPTADATPTEIARIDRYKFNGTVWSYEYSLNNSGFTSAQWAAINSEITSALVTKLSDLPTNTELQNALAGKQPTIDAQHKLNYNLLDNTPTIPDELSDLTDDATHRLVTDSEKTTWNGKQDLIDNDHKLSYNLLSDTPTIPTLESMTDLEIQAAVNAAWV